MCLDGVLIFVMTHYGLQLFLVYQYSIDEFFRVVSEVSAVKLFLL